MTSLLQHGLPLTYITGVALAGGQSSRMGCDKAALALSGRPLITRTVDRLREALAVVIVSGPVSLAELTPGARVISDIHPGLGPLGGLATALDSVETPWIFLVACDMPFIQPMLVRHMGMLALNSPDAEAIALRSPDGLEPLHAAYRSDVAPAVARALASPRPSMRGLLAQLRVREVSPQEVAILDPRGLSTFNANTPGDWDRALALAADEDGEGA